MITFVSEIMVCLSLVEGNFDKSVHTAACLLGILLHKYYLFSSLKSTHFVLELQMDIYTHPATEVTVSILRLNWVTVPSVFILKRCFWCACKYAFWFLFCFDDARKTDTQTFSLALAPWGQELQPYKDFSLSLWHTHTHKKWHRRERERERERETETETERHRERTLSNNHAFIRVIHNIKKKYIKKNRHDNFLIATWWNKKATLKLTACIK